MGFKRQTFVEITKLDDEGIPYKIPGIVTVDTKSDPENKRSRVSETMVRPLEDFNSPCFIKNENLKAFNPNATQKYDKQIEAVWEQLQDRDLIKKDFL